MKKTAKITTVLLLTMLISAVVVPAVSADTSMQPWEEEFLNKYGEHWMYEEYGNVWFDYFYYEDDMDTYNELLQKYQMLWELYDKFPSSLEFWEAEFLLEYGNIEMYEEYGEYWFDYYLYNEYQPEHYAELSRMFKELKAEHTELEVIENPVQNETNITTSNITNITLQNTTNTTVLNITNTTIQNITEKPEQNVTAPQDSEKEFPAVPFVIAAILVILLVAAGAFIFVKQKRSASDNTKDLPSEHVFEPVKDEVTATSVKSEDTEKIVDVPVIKPKAEVRLTTPKECYSAVASYLADKHGIPHSESLTPRQLLEFGEPTTELREFIKLYEQIRYAPKTGKEDVAKLAELAGKILKQ